MQPRGISQVRNFGGNIRFRPRKRYLPKDEDDVLRILDEHRTGTVRVIGAGHSWNGGIETSDALLDLRHLRRIRVHSDRRRVSVGGGCRIAEVLAHLAPCGLTLPSIGLIARQSVAGAVATGTHGSGRHSMSHYVESMRIACYDADGEAEVRTVDSGQTLRAARCSVGALGVVVEVTLKCVPQYYVCERCVWRPDLDAVLDNESVAPLQQFYLMPRTWAYLEHERSVASDNRPSGGSLEARIPAGNRLKSYGAARSAFPAVELDLAGTTRESGKNGPEWREPRALAGPTSELPHDWIGIGCSTILGRPASPTTYYCPCGKSA
ncbi:MAG: FAD-binding protein [Gammaproteobacteria bacterium]|nr:FAD-binding protein [Gammaproteobacteria bacterium]MYK69220.1 FAD-binding protein [Gammaproteobacteria bacterium]